MDLTPTPLITWVCVAICAGVSGALMYRQIIGPGSRLSSYVGVAGVTVIGGLLGGVILAWFWPILLVIGAFAGFIFLLGSGLYRIDKARRARRG